MAIHNILSGSGEWLRGEGPHQQIVISSRLRLARNLRGFAFPGWAKRTERIQILETLKPRVEELPEMNDAFSVYSQDLSALEKQVLVERHLISREHAAKGVGSAVVMQMKLSLALALAHRPALLILDEPTAGMDPVARREFLDLIAVQARNHGRTTFFSTHLIDEVQRVADRVGIIDQGWMRYEGSVAELRAEVRRVS